MGHGWNVQTAPGARGLALIWGGVAACACAAMIPLEPSVLEEGVMLHFAQRIVHGEHLYRDMVFFTGPFPFELLALLFRIFGEEVAVARLAVVVLAGTATAASFATARRAGAGPAAHVVAAGYACAPILFFPLLSIYFYTTLALLLASVAAFTALRGLNERGFAVAAGCLASLVALTKQNIGLVLGPGLLLAIAMHAPRSIRVRQTLLVVAGAAAVAVVTFAVYGGRGDFGLLFHSLVVMPLSLGTGFGSPYLSLWPVGQVADDLAIEFYFPYLINVLPPESGSIGTSLVVLTQLLYAVPFLALLAPVARRFIKGPLGPGIWISTVVVLALLAQLFPRSDWGHLVFVLPPAFALLVLCVATGPGDVKSPWHAGVSVLVVAALGVLSLSLAVAVWRAAGEAPFGTRAPQRATTPLYKHPSLRRAVDFLRARVEPGEAIFVARAEALFYFATDASNPTPYPGIIPGLGEEQDRIVIEGLAQVRYVVMSERDSAAYFYYRDELPETQRYLERHFRVPEELADQWSLTVVLERGDDRGATAADLFDRAEQADAWMLDDHGRKVPVMPGIPKLGTSRNRRPLPVLLGYGGGGIDFDVTVPTGGVFQAGLGVRYLEAAENFVEHVSDSTFQVLVRKGSKFEVLASRQVVLGEDPSIDWKPFEVDLADFAGSEVTLRLQVVPAEPLEKIGIAWWGSPRLISRDPAAFAGADQSSAR